MNKKKQGYLLLELLLSFSLGTVLIFVIYKTYFSVKTVVSYIENANSFEFERGLLIYHLERDMLCALISKKNYQLYSLLNEKTKTSAFALKSDYIKNDSEDKKKEKIEKEYKKCAFFIPSLTVGKEGVSFSWVTSRTLFTEEKWAKVSYIFKKNIDFQGKENYSVFRREDEIGDNFEMIKKGRENALVSKMTDLKISFIYPIINKETKDASATNDKEKNDVFLAWTKSPQYENVSSYDPMTENTEKLLESFRYPSAVVIRGKWLSMDDTKSYPIEIYSSFPYVISILQEYAAAAFGQKETKESPSAPKENIITNKSH